MTFTDNQKAIINNDRSEKRVHIVFPNADIADIEADRIYQESMSLEESLFDNDNIQFGKCNGSLFQIKVADFADDIDGLEMDVYITFTHEDLGSVTVEFGKYLVQNVERTSDRRWRIITATDFMTKFDTDVADWYNNTLYGEVYVVPTGVKYSGYEAPITTGIVLGKHEYNPVYPDIDQGDKYINLTNGYVYELEYAIVEYNDETEIRTWFGEWTYVETIEKTLITSRTVKEIRELLCSYIGTDYEDVTLINDNLVIGKTINPNTLSARDLLQYCCEVNCCFGHFDWEGILKFITLDYNGLYPSPNLYPSDTLFPRGSGENTEDVMVFKSCNYADYDVKGINAVAIAKEDGDLSVVYQMPEVVAEYDYENRYNVIGNPLLYGFSTTDLLSIAENICKKIAYRGFTPNVTEVFSMIYMTLGQPYKVHANIVIGTDIIDNIISSFVIKRTIRGIQAIFSSLEASCNEYIDNASSFDVMSEFKILQGKSAKYKRDLESLEVEYQDFEAETNSKFIQTANEIQTTVGAVQTNWLEEYPVGTPITIKYKNYGAPQSTVATSDVSSIYPNYAVNDLYLNIDRGYVYKLIDASIDGDDTLFTWTYQYALTSVKRNLQSQITQTAEAITSEVTRAQGVEGALSTRITQTAEAITSEVAGYQTTWDEENYNIKWKEYDKPNQLMIETGETAPAVNDYFLNIDDGKLYRLASVSLDTSSSDEDYSYYNVTYTFVKQLTTTRQAVSSEISQTATEIRSEVSTADGALSSRIQQTLKTITLEVDDNGTSAGLYLTTTNEGGSSSARTRVGTITLNGLVRFTNLQTAGETTINGANITTGYISCDRLDGGAISGQEIIGGTIAGTEISGSVIRGDLVFRNSLGDMYVLYDNYEGTVNPMSIAINGTGYSDGIKIYGMMQLADDALYLASRGVSGIYSPYVLNYLVREYPVATSLTETTWYNAFGNTQQGTRIYGATIWANHSIDTPSDERLKEDYRTLDELEKAFFALEPCSYTFKTDKDKIRHVGFKAQQVEKAINDSGLKSDDFSFVNLTGAEEEMKEYITDNILHTLRYDEFMALNTHIIQKQQQQINNLNEELATLKQQVAILMQGGKKDE